MFKKIQFASILAILAIALGDQPQVQLSLASAILNSADAIQSDPQRSAQCFAVYMPKLDNLTATYQQQYQACIEVSDAGKKSIQADVTADGTHVNQTFSSICSEFSKCNTYSYGIEYFECSSLEAGQSLNTIYDVQNLSKSKLQYIHMRLEAIQYNQNVCTEKSNQAYVADSVKVHSNLQDCLAGQVSASSTSTISSVESDAPPK